MARAPLSTTNRPDPCASRGRVQPGQAWSLLFRSSTSRHLNASRQNKHSMPKAASRVVGAFRGSGPQTARFFSYSSRKRQPSDRTLAAAPCGMGTLCLCLYVCTDIQTASMLVQRNSDRRLVSSRFCAMHRIASLLAALHGRSVLTRYRGWRDVDKRHDVDIWSVASERINRQQNSRGCC